jgi:hypothetical protein
VGGATGVDLDKWSFGLVVTYLLLLPFVLLTKMDTGVVFCRRADFETIGGYNETKQFAEDTAFLWELRHLGKKRGQSLVRTTDVKAVASTRKFDEHGEWHYFTMLPRFAWSVARGKDASEMADRYWYKPNR